MNPLAELTNDATGRALRAALNLATMTHQVIAHNIANANSPGFVPLRVRFERDLEMAAGAYANSAGSNSDGSPSDSPGMRIEPDPDAAVGATGTSSLDMQMAKMNENMIRYQMLLHGMNQRITLIDLALNDGKR